MPISNLKSLLDTGYQNKATTNDLERISIALGHVNRKGRATHTYDGTRAFTDYKPSYAIPRKVTPLGLPVKEVKKKMRIVKGVDLNIPHINTIFINNLSEKVKIPTMKNALKAAFEQFGPICDIVAMSSIKRRGQAYLSFEEKEHAVNAMRAMQGFPLFEKPLRIEMAKCNSDKIAKKLGDYKARPPRPPRMTRKERRQQAYMKKLEDEKRMHEEIMNNPLTAPLKPIFQFGNAPPPPPGEPTDLSRFGEEGTGINIGGASINNESFNQMNFKSQHPHGAPPPPPVDNLGQAPNNILFVERLPPDTTEVMVSVLFHQFAGYKETRLVPGRADIAFVEFDKVEQAIIAKTQLHSFKITPTHAMKVSFAKK